MPGSVFRTRLERIPRTLCNVATLISSSFSESPLDILYSYHDSFHSFQLSARLGLSMSSSGGGFIISIVIRSKLLSVTLLVPCYDPKEKESMEFTLVIFNVVLDLDLLHVRTNIFKTTTSCPQGIVGTI